jgi:hypothetical protein
MYVFETEPAAASPARPSLILVQLFEPLTHLVCLTAYSATAKMKSLKIVQLSFKVS